MDQLVCSSCGHEELEERQPVLSLRRGRFFVDSEGALSYEWTEPASREEYPAPCQYRCMRCGRMFDVDELKRRLVLSVGFSLVTLRSATLRLQELGYRVSVRQVDEGDPPV